MARREFKRGMRVRRTKEHAESDDQLDADDVGEVIIPRDANGDVHVQFARSGSGVLRPSALEILDEPTADDRYVYAGNEKPLEVGMRVRISGAHVDPGANAREVGDVVVARDANGDVHVNFPRSGFGVFPPEDLEIVEALPESASDPNP